MNTTHLYEFLVLANTMNYSKAAKILYISQSILSRHIQQLEAEFGVPLLLRSSHSVALTEAGRVLVNEGPRLLQKCQGSLARLRGSQTVSQGKIHIGLALEYSYSRHIREFLRKFSSDYPQIELIYDIQAGKTPRQTVEAYDLFFTPCDFPELPSNMERIKFQSHGIYAILPPGHSFMAQGAIYLHQLSGQTIIVPYADELFGPYAKNYVLAEKAGKGTVSCIKVDNLATALFLVSTGKGICLAPHYVKNLLPANSFMVSVSDRRCKFNEFLYYNQRGNHAAELFFQEIMQAQSMQAGKIYTQ